MFKYEDVLALKRITGMIVVGCASCRKVLGVLPPEIQAQVGTAFGTDLSESQPT